MVTRGPIRESTPMSQEAASHQPESPIVILAMPRSGSQLLRALLNSHPDVFIAADSAVIPTLFNPALSSQQIGEALSEEFDETQRTYEHLLESLRTFIHSFCITNGEPTRLGSGPGGLPFGRARRR